MVIFRTFVLQLLSALLFVIPGFSSDAKQLAEAQALLDRAETVSSLTAANAVPFFLELQFDRTPTNLSGKGGAYKLWWAGNKKWRAEAEAGDSRDFEIRNDEGLWSREDIDPKLAAIFSGARRFPFGGRMLAWNEKIVGLRERQLNGVKLPCVQTERLDEQREFCFDRETGVLIQTIAVVPVHSSLLLTQFEPREFVTEYLEYSSAGKKMLPAEIRISSAGKVVVSVRMVKVALQPMEPFAADMFTVPDKYQLWQTCEQYQAAGYGKNFWRQAPGLFDPAWFTGAGRIADGARIVVGSKGKAEDVQLLNPVGKPSKLAQSALMNETYDPAICDGKPVAGLLFLDFRAQ